MSLVSHTKKWGRVFVENGQQAAELVSQGLDRMQIIGGTLNLFRDVTGVFRMKEPSVGCNSIDSFLNKPWKHIRVFSLRPQKPSWNFLGPTSPGRVKMGLDVRDVFVRSVRAGPIGIFLKINAPKGFTISFVHIHYPKEFILVVI